MAPGPRAARLFLSPSVRRKLKATASSATESHRAVQRARIVMLAGKGKTSAEIARRVGCTERTVRKWRARFARCSTEHALDDAQRSGRPPKVPLDVRCRLIQLACDRPTVPFRDVWTQEMLGVALQAATGWKLSRSEIGRILRTEDLRPHKMRLWLHSPDPDFATKVRAICQLYTEPPPGATVLCVDEKTCIQALEHEHPMRFARPGLSGRREFEYVRHGTRTLIAAFDVRTGEVFGQVRRRRTADDLRQFMQALARRYPEGEVYIVWDNLNIHLGDAWVRFNAEHGGRFHFVHTPLHASWMNQIEVWFGILHRRLLRHGNFENSDQLARRIEGFIKYWNRIEAHPFRWTFRGRFTQDRRRLAA